MARIASPKGRERVDARLELKMRKSFKDKLAKFAQSSDLEMSVIMREGAQTIMDGRLPILGRIPCGPMQQAIQETPYYEIAPPIMRPRADLGDYFLEAAGDSMTPDIRNGDLVMLRPNIEWQNGEVCAVQVFHDKNLDGDCEATLKKVFRNENSRQLTLKANNAEFKPMRVDAECVKIVGVFRGLLRRDN